jgi:cold shock CspA family protein
MQGTVLKFACGWGFIKPDEGVANHFVFHRDVAGGKLRPGERVSYELGRNTDGRVKAINVKIVEDTEDNWHLYVGKVFPKDEEER